jgi:hypothetical protein
MCKGFGNTFENTLKDKMCICKGHGTIFQNIKDKTWRAKYSKETIYY